MTRVLMALTLAGWSGAAFADSHADVGLLLGSTGATTEAPALRFDRGTTYQATLGWCLWQRSAFDLRLDVPFIATPAFTVLNGVPSLPLEYASLYLTPGVRVTIRPRSAVSAFGAVGAGYARYTESQLRADRSPNPEQQDTNAGAFGFGGGIDVRGIGWLGFRGEVRDVYTGARRFSIATPGRRVHNVVASGGLVVRF